VAELTEAAAGGGRTGGAPAATTRGGGARVLEEEASPGGGAWLRGHGRARRGATKAFPAPDVEERRRPGRSTARELRRRRSFGRRRG
jgi:hypothetical protein